MFEPFRKIAQLRKIIGNPAPHDQQAQNAIAELELEYVKLDRSDLTKMSEKDKQTLRAEIDREIDALNRL